MTAADVARIDVYSRWVGSSSPVEAARVTVRRAAGGFVREVALGGPPEPLPAEVVAELVAALAAPPVPALDPARFDAPAAGVERHLNSLWSNDSPSLLVRLTAADGTVAEARTDSQHVFLLPFRVGTPPADTFDPRLSRAVAGLLPADHHLLDKLLDRHGTLAAEAAESEREADRPTVSPAEPAEPFDENRFHQLMHDLMVGNESPEQKAESERAGRLSERLLRNLSADDVRDLLARGADPSVADDVGQTALMHAAFPPLAVERFRLLAAAGADVEARRNDGLTGLHLACAGGMADATAEWLRAGADVHARTPDDDATPLMLGARWPEVVGQLLAAGADPNAADRDGHSPLAYTVIQQSGVGAENERAARRLLLAAGADVNRRDTAGVTPLGHARQTAARAALDAEVCQALFGADRPSPMLATAEAVVAELIAAGGAE
jgi:hypothetical protein